MRMRGLLPALLLLLPGLPAAADEVLDGTAFRELAEGWTLHFELDGRLFGSEQYLPGDRTIWRPGTEGCERGVWWEQSGAICFAYEGQPAPQCWIMTRRNGDIFARTVEDIDGTGEIRMSGRDRAPLACQGPAVGV
jgi:hypothetical protein